MCKNVSLFLQESVLDAKLQNKQQQQLSSLGSADADDRVSSTDDARSGVSTDIIYSLVQQHDNLRSAIMKYESIVSELETVWKEKVWANYKSKMH